MQDYIFREYDIRGKVGLELDPEQVYDFAQAFAFYLKSKNIIRARIAVAMDGRTHSPLIKEALCAGLLQSGMDVLFLGTCPTPVLYFCLFDTPVEAAIMITASHNPADYNGMKLCLSRMPIWGSEIRVLRDLFKARKKITDCQPGAYTELFLIERYIDFLHGHFPLLRGMQMPLLIDCAHGAAGTVLPQLIKKMGWTHTHLLYPEVDGTFPAHEADPTKEENMAQVKKMLAEGHFELGLGLDGDCDRMSAMTKTGILVEGDVLLALFSQAVLGTHPNASVVFDVRSSEGLIELLELWQARPCISPSGHSLIKNTMKETDAMLGGELSCHFFFKDRYFGYDDGIYAFMRLLELLHTQQKTLEECIKIFPKKFSTREIRIPCSETLKKQIVHAVTEKIRGIPGVSVITIDGVRAKTADGWGLLRASNTEALLSLRFESPSESGLTSIKSLFFFVLKEFFDQEHLRQSLEP